MKKLILFILFTVKLSATNWYVDGALTGNDNGGTSWADAWESLAEINWASLDPGDYLYISGGADSLVYNERIVPDVSGTAANYITIIIGKYSPSPSGHSGRVILDGTGLAASNIHVQSKNYLLIKGFECRDAEDLGVYIEDYSQGVILDSLYVYDTDDACIFVNGSGTYGVDSTVIRNCRILTPAMYGGQTDGIGVQNAQHTLIYNNYVRQLNQDPLAHNDCVQGHLANGLIMYNNILISDSVNSPEGGGYAGILGWENTLPVIIANNYMYMGGIWYLAGADSRTLSLRWYDNDPMPPAWVINNTIVSNGPKTMAAENEFRGTYINNILAQYIDDETGYTMSPIFGIMGTDAPGDPMPIDSLRNNLFYRSWGASMFTTGYRVTGNGNTGYPTSWSNWTTTYGGTGVYAEDPLFVDNIGYEPDQGLLDGELQSGSPAIDAGENLEDFIDWLNDTYNLTGEWAIPKTDINGNSRDANWDIGAYEYGAGGWSPPDTVPSFSFTALTNRELNTEYVASSVFSSADSTFHVWTTTSALFKINYNGTYSTAMKEVDAGDTVYVKNQSSSNYSTMTTETIVAGGYSRNFDVTTKAEPPPSGEGTLARSSDGKIIKTSDGKLIKVQP